MRVPRSWSYPAGVRGSGIISQQMGGAAGRLPLPQEIKGAEVCSGSVGGQVRHDRPPFHVVNAAMFRAIGTAPRRSSSLRTGSRDALGSVGVGTDWSPVYPCSAGRGGLVARFLPELMAGGAWYPLTHVSTISVELPL